MPRTEIGFNRFFFIFSQLQKYCSRASSEPVPSCKSICGAKGKVGDAGGRVTFDLGGGLLSVLVLGDSGASKDPKERNVRPLALKLLTTQEAALKLVK